MSFYTCHDCQTEVRGGEALLRSVSFRQVAYCRDCWTTNHGPTLVPGPRRSPEDAWDTARQDA